MLHLKKVLGAKPKEHVEAELATLFTPWGEALDINHVLEEHPSPQFARSSYRVLNGVWNCTFTNSGHAPNSDLPEVVTQASAPTPDQFAQQIIVPFSPEAPLSRVERQLQPTELLWYRRTFDAPDRSSETRVLLHFEAVDYTCNVRVNGASAGTHVGGYTPFALDITDLLVDGPNELTVCVADPSEFGGRIRGKQRFDRGDIWYTAQSGIWQTVWLEVVPSTYIASAVIEPDAESGILSVGVHVAQGVHDEPSPSPCEFQLEVIGPDGKTVASGIGEVSSSTGAVAVSVPDVHLWSPDDPFLYGLKLSYGDDEVESYCAFRTVKLQRDAEGHKRVFLNDKPLFIKGVLDQAYWSDGLMTAPSDEALVFDIEAMRDAGFNLMRKHIKIESARWYYHCDRLGMLVIQEIGRAHV